MGDEELIEQILDGDQNAIEELHDRYVHRIFNSIFMQTSHYHDAEELLQDVFYKTATQLHTFKGRSSFETWIFKITRNTIVDYYRKNEKRNSTITMSPNILDYMAGSGESAEVTVLRNLDFDNVMETLEKLSDQYRTVLYLRFIEGFSIKETAKIMGRTVLSIKALQNRARKKFFEQIDAEVMNYE